jgi:hypothetical protein
MTKKVGKRGDNHPEGFWWMLAAALMVLIYLSGCRTPKVQTTSQYQKDSTYLKELARLKVQVDSVSNGYYQLKSKKTLVEKHLEVLLTDTLAEPDSLIAVKRLRKAVGEAYVVVDYQGEIIAFELFIPERVSSVKETADSGYYYFNQLRIARDSAVMWEEKYLKQKERVSKTVTVDNTPLVFKWIPQWIIWLALGFPVFQFLRMLFKWFRKKGI